VSTNHLGCCCLPDTPGGSCDVSCTYPTSFSLSDVAGSWHYEHRVPIKDETCACFGGALNTVMMGYSVDIGFSQETTVTMTRCGSGSACGYEARGEMTISTNIQIEESSWCCSTGEFDIQEKSYATVTNNVPFCLTMYCVPSSAVGCARTISGQSHWLIALQICDYAAVPSHDFLVEDFTPACAVGLTDPYGIAVGGATLVKVAKMKNPANWFSTDIADFGVGNASNRCVNPPIGTDIEGSTACIPCVGARSPHGPFALYKIGEYSEQDVPDPCTLSCSASNPFASPQHAFGRPGGTPNACSSTINPTAGPCYSIEDQWTGSTAYNPSVCTEPCEISASVGGEWTFEVG
jgi:hypothetical protein